MSTNNEKKIGQALGYLMNNWRCDPELRRSFEQVFQSLNCGSDKDRANAQVLLEYLNYPGSEDAQFCASLFHKGFELGSVKALAGFPQNRRGPKKSPGDVKLEDKLMQVLIRHELGKATDFDLESAIIEHLGFDAVPATQKVFMDGLRPRAKMWASFFRHVQSSFEEGKPL